MEKEIAKEATEDYYPKIKFPKFCNTSWKKFVWLISIFSFFNPLFYIVLIFLFGINFYKITNEEMRPIYEDTRYYFGYFNIYIIILYIVVVMFA